MRADRFWWQLSYNLACQRAKAGRADDALDWLETATERRGCEQLTVEWLKSDPDLKTIRGTPRFEWIASSVPSIPMAVGKSNG